MRVRLVSKGWLACLGITAFWIVMMGLWAQRHGGFVARPQEEADSDTAPGVPKAQVWRLAILLNEKRIGVAHTFYAPLGDGGAVIRTHVKLASELTFLNDLEATAAITLGGKGRLVAFNARFGSSKVEYAIRGTVFGDNLELVTSFGGQSVSQMVPFEGRAFFSSTLTPLLAGLELPQGERRPIALWNPLLRRMETAWIENKGRTPVPWNGVRVLANEYQLSYGEMALSSWVGENGEILRQEAPFGIVLQKED